MQCNAAFYYACNVIIVLKIRSTCYENTRGGISTMSTCITLASHILQANTIFYCIMVDNDLFNTYTFSVLIFGAVEIIFYVNKGAAGAGRTGGRRCNATF